MRDRLRRLDQSTQSICTLSLWICHHQKKRAEVIVRIWLEEVLAEKNPSKLISLLYLANDVVQNSRKKSPSNVNEWMNVFGDAFRHLISQRDPSLDTATQRILSVWNERAIYPRHQLQSLASILGVSLLSSTKTGTESSQVSTPSTSSPEPVRKRTRAEDTQSSGEDRSPSTAQFLQFLRRLENAPSADAHTRRLIASFPESLANTGYLREVANGEQADELHKKIKEAEPVVSNYCTRLAVEMTTRREVQNMLGEYLEAQKMKATNMEKLLASFREKRDRLLSDKAKVYKHYDSLPDISALPMDKPLPSELFE